MSKLKSTPRHRRHQRLHCLHGVLDARGSSPGLENRKTTPPIVHLCLIIDSLPEYVHCITCSCPSACKPPPQLPNVLPRGAGPRARELEVSHDPSSASVGSFVHPVSS